MSRVSDGKGIRATISFILIFCCLVEDSTGVTCGRCQRGSRRVPELLVFAG